MWVEKYWKNGAFPRPSSRCFCCSRSLEGMCSVLRGCSGAAIPPQGVRGTANGSRGPSRGIIRSEGGRIAKTKRRDRITSTTGFRSVNGGGNLSLAPSRVDLEGGPEAAAKGSGSSWRRRALIAAQPRRDHTCSSELFHVFNSGMYYRWNGHCAAERHFNFLQWIFWGK